MAGAVSHKLKNSFEGALAGGGDPATSPLYVFGPFLRLIIVAGVAQITFGASVWLVILTIAMVSAMYRLVMSWVTDGSGGSGLSEEEFGGWAVKINAAITFVEYTLTFLVSMAAMVTFIADRAPALNERVLGIQYRTFVAIGLSIFTGWLVNRGPKTAARAFGPATFGVLVLLWVMIVATIWKLGFHLPDFNLQAFSREYLFEFTLGGYARMLAVMTGIEVFANLVAAYEGDAAVKSKKAFKSLLIIMGSTGATMLIVGPAIYRVTDIHNTEVSVFTQTMDYLLPAPLPFIGTLIGIAVLLSASAASAQGLQNLALGLKSRHYVPAFIGEINQFDVADKPVWIQVGICSLCFLLFGTSEETYLAIYAAGVFILLSMTGWAVIKRLIRQVRASFSMTTFGMILGTSLAALLTTGATIIIFEERFSEGAWTYFLFIPVLYAVFSYYRKKLGPPSQIMEQLGKLEHAMQGGFGFGQAEPALVTAAAGGVGEIGQTPPPVEIPSAAIPVRPLQKMIRIKHVLIPLDGSLFAEHTLPVAQVICQAHDARLTLLAVLPMKGSYLALSPPQSEGGSQFEAGRKEKEEYLSLVAQRMKEMGVDVDYVIADGHPVAETINSLSREIQANMVIISTHGRSGISNWLMGGVANKIIQLVNRPTLVIRPVKEPLTLLPPPQIKRILVPLDGSEIAEQALAHACGLATAFKGEVLLLAVPEVPDAAMYGSMTDLIAQMRAREEAKSIQYLESLTTRLQEAGVSAQSIVTGSNPAHTIISVSESAAVDLIVLTSHGRGAGVDRLLMGNVAERIVRHTHRLVYLVPVHKKRAPS